MSEFEKLLERLKSKPKDFTYKELNGLMSKCGFKVNNKGKTSGSRIEYKGSNGALRLHKPHNRNFLHDYEIKAVIDFLVQEGFI